MTRRAIGLWALVMVVALAAIVSAALLVDALLTRYERDVSRMVFNDNVGLLERVRRQAGLEADSLRRALDDNPAPRPAEPYLVVSIEDHLLWYRRGDSVLFTAPVGTGSGRTTSSAGAMGWFHPRTRSRQTPAQVWPSGRSRNHRPHSPHA